MKYTVLLALLLGLAARGVEWSGEPRTITAEERDRSVLFPGVDSFVEARVGLCDDTVWCAEVVRTGGEALLIALTPREAQRVLFMVDSPEAYARQVLSHPDAPQALEEFWTGIEAKADSFLYRPRSVENRAMWANRGCWMGATAGGIAGSHLGITYVGQSGGCLDYGIYHLNQPLFWGTACGAAAVGAGTGFLVGNGIDRRPQPPVYIKEPTSNRRLFGGIGAIAGLAVGSAFFFMNGPTLFGRLPWFDSEIDNDPSRFSVIPALAAGVGIAVDLTYLGYLIGRRMDRDEADKAAKEREQRLERLLPLPSGP